ncbi:hypothetical protein AB0L05_29780 [Nonomuraea pusilla]|uniref:hypothetical protein n=1 Tax=Nonomuraea pusilla TaxID=46177 RepID=UPI003333BBC3
MSMRGTAAALLSASGAAMVVAGPVLAAMGGKGRAQIRAELRRQVITFPDKGLPGELAAQAGRQVLTGPQAMMFAEVIGRNVAQATGGRTYAEVSAELLAADEDDPKLAALRQTAFTGQMLRAGLLNAYQAWQVTSLVIGLGGLLTGAGAALLATGAVLAQDR